MKKDNPLLHAILYALVILFSIVFIIAGYFICRVKTTDIDELDYYCAKITQVKQVSTQNYGVEGVDEDVSVTYVSFKALITSGKYKGETVYGQQYIDSMYGTGTIEVKENDKVVLSDSGSYGNTEDSWIYICHNRISVIIGLLVLFFICILLLGGLKGVTTIISLFFTVCAIFLVYIPSILKGYNIYLSTTIIGCFIILMSLLIINGFDRKTLCAIIGNVAGVFCAGILALIMNELLGITGLIDEDYVFITHLNVDNPINLRAIVWGGVLIGSLGAIMDVAMSIASSMYELSLTMRRKSFRNMLISGMNIGKDAIATMTNTLIMAYVGGSLAVVLLFLAYNKNLLYLLNMEMIVVEILQAIVGSLGILFAVPATALFAAYIYNNKKRKNKKNINKEFESLNNLNKYEKARQYVEYKK